MARDFSQFPAGRVLKDGPFSGEAFRDELLAPALKTHEAVTVLLDGTMGYGSSFLKEAFGGLVRVHGFSIDEIRAKLTLTTLDMSLEREIWSYIDGP